VCVCVCVSVCLSVCLPIQPLIQSWSVLVKLVNSVLVEDISSCYFSSAVQTISWEFCCWNITRVSECRVLNFSIMIGIVKICRF
jgi:hypothetical protein